MYGSKNKGMTPKSGYSKQTAKQKMNLKGTPALTMKGIAKRKEEMEKAMGRKMTPKSGMKKK